MTAPTENMTEIQLGKALSLLGDAFLVLEQAKLSPPLQRRITGYLDNFSMDERIRLIRKGGNV